ncbi:MAG: hypothetical protein ACPG9T_14280, partial [Pseudomonadales bacterium]
MSRKLREVTKIVMLGRYFLLLGLVLIGPSVRAATAVGEELEQAIAAKDYRAIAYLLETRGAPLSDLPLEFAQHLESARAAPEGMEDLLGAYEALSLEAEASFTSGNLDQGLIDQEGVVSFSADLLGEG